MSCLKDDALLERYMDGELEPSLIARVEAALEECQHCRDHIEAFEAIQGAMRAEIVDAVARAPLDQLWGRIDEQLQAAKPRVVPDAPVTAPTAAPAGWVARLRVWWETQRLEAALGGLAAAAAILVCVWFVQSMPTTKPVADPATAAVEMTNLPDNTLVIESAEAESGTILIDIDPEDPSTPAVVWHIVDDDEGRI